MKVVKTIRYSCSGLPVSGNPVMCEMMNWHISSIDVYLAMKIIETSVFTKRLKVLLSNEDYRLLQNEIILNPGKGKIIRGSGWLRKIRWSIRGKGKSGGVRIIYYWFKTKEIILMLLIYSKNEQDDLSKEQLKLLKFLVEKEFKWKTNYFMSYKKV